MNEEQLNEMGSRRGFIAALDQSGGSTPKALALYGIPETAYGNEGQMFDLMHEARARLIESPSFTGDKILAAILFEQTMDRTINGEDTVAFLWKQKHIVPFVKVDQGLADVQYGVQLMKPMTKLDSLLERAVEKGVFGTKMRSFIQEPNDGGIKAIVDQQFDTAEVIAQHDLMPIIEPEVSIKCPDKGTADHLLVIGRGRLLADTPLSELIARNSDERVEVRAADPGRMAADLRTVGAQVTMEPDGTLSVLGLGSKQIGELAAERGHVLRQLRDVTVSLEEAYFRLTGESVEYRAPVPVAA